MNKVEKFMSNLSDTDLFLGMATVLTQILTKLPIALRMSIIPEEDTIAQAHLEEFKKRLNKGVKK